MYKFKNYKGGNFMIRKTYATEREGQIDFYESYLPLIDGSLIIEDIFADNNDGVLKGNILEFKIMINDPNSVLFQTVKYLSARRIKGKSVPRNIILISLNDSKAYLYNSEDYLIDIEKIYSGGASKNNKSFICKDPKKIIDFNCNQLDEKKLIDILKENKFTKINIDDNCIVGWVKNTIKNIQVQKNLTL